MEEMLNLLQKSVLWELLEKYPDFCYFDETNLIRTMQDVYRQTQVPFVVIIDEWDCIFREYTVDAKAQKNIWIFYGDY